MTRSPRLDDAARAGWLYYVAGNTQDDVARTLGVSRQAAQRLVSLAVREGLVKVRIDHPIGACLELGARLRERFSLALVEVVPSDPASASSTLGVADAAAAELERRLSAAEPVRLAVGTGRTLKAAIDKLPSMECPQHEIVSLTGSIAPDGSAAFFNVIFSLADKVKARSFPMPLPVIASSREERALLHSQPMIAATLERAAAADLTFLGIGDLGPSAPLFVDGFLTGEELASLTQAGAVGEILGWAFDSQGRLIEGLTNERVASAPLSSRPGGLVVAIAKGENKAPGILGALKGGLVNGLLTDEATAARLLAV